MDRKRSNLPAAIAVTICLCLIALYLVKRNSQQISASVAASGRSGENDPRLAGAYRFERGKWTYVHLQGPPEHQGYQHGYLLSAEIADAFAAIKLEDTH